MGIIWRSIMPLLSTLAALVIIVHSAEEEMNRGYRRDLRPRAVETASYEQPWKAIDHPPPQPPEPVHQPTRAEGWIESLEFLRSVEEVPPRRRPVRKRKRRPLPYPDTEPLERHQESIQAAHTEFHDQTIDAPRRRRKRPEHISYHFTEQPALADDRPLRRRGLRKKRPDYDEQLDDPSQADFDPVVTKLEHHQTFPKYKQFDYDYLDTEHNTEIPEVNVRLETDVTDQPYNVRNEYNNKHETSYNRLNGFQEQNKQTAGASESESISSLEENFDINTKITEETAMKEPKAQSIENATSNPENNSSIMDAINRTKVQKLKLGIIINGTEHSYLPLLIPSEEIYDHFEDLFVTQPINDNTSISNSVFNTDYTSQSTTKMSLPTQAPKVSVSNVIWDEMTEKVEDSRYGGQSPLNFTAEDSILKNITDHTSNVTNYISLYNTDKKINYTILSKPLQKYFNSHDISENDIEEDEDLSYGDQLANETIGGGGLLKSQFWSGKSNISHRPKEPKIFTLPMPIVKAFLPYYIRNQNTDLTENYYSTEKVLTSKDFSNSNTERYHRLNNLDLNSQKTNNIHLSIPAEKFLLAYGVSNNDTERLKDFTHVEKPTQKSIPVYNFPEMNTGKSYSSINLGHDDNKLHYILFPISPTKYIAIYYRLKDKGETSNVNLNLDVSDTEQIISLPKLEEENGINTHSAIMGDIAYIPKEESVADYGKEIVLDTSKSANQFRNKTGIIKYSRKHFNNGYFTKKWINTNKLIGKVNVIMPVLPLEENFELELMPEELEESGAIDPIMLKQLLKRSNGSSLSEMLQRHNLSLTDLLQGRNEAISALNAGGTYEPQQSTDISLESNSKLNEAETKYPARRQTSSKEKKVPTDSNSVEDTEGPKSNGNTENDEPVANKDTTKTENQESKPRISTKRRFPTGIRRKLRMRPTLNSTLKAQLSRDLIALSARKYSNNNKNVTKSREWKDIVPMMPDRSKTDNNEDSKDEVTETAPTTTYDPVETTTSSLKVSNSFYSLSGGKNVSNVKDNEVEKVATTTTEATTTITIEVMPDEIMSEIEKPKITPIVRPNATNSTLRRQAFNNRLKRKRLKQKSSTTENPSDDLMRNFLGMANLVSASQFIERTQKPDTTVKMDNTEFVTELEDFLTTETPPETVDIGVKSTSRFTTSTTPRILAQKSSTSTTEQTAKFEIQEILSDKMTKERLAKILRDRNMTLNELVNHRERGSSHVHLADIFHNASKEPNPPEPFLTKSSIEPISKETYPLRAILEANTYETTTRTLLSQTDQKNILIPVVMNFGNNVNENGESMGIISLFNKIAENEVTIDKTEIRKDSEGTPYLSSIISVNATNANDTNRESRSMGDSEDWNELLSFMKAHNISTFEEDLQTLNKGNTEKESLENLEGDGLMILEDLQNLENFQSDTAIGSGENVEISIQEKRENLSKNAGILNKLPNNTKSVAIATASILGLAAILFLLTYIAFKWKQQRNKMRKKKSFCDGPIPSPVFENRKSNKNNCSSRSISPMISNTNIYMSTLETNSGKESPDYMWNSLRKPFQ
ncbi:uncharacterized protein LOC133525652 isoform X1 [Cydia pomonella]|uniref:uncharacterized protein LOC133525652 isoform X1 n=1 Tax=Cydia pomonella TaxID=82600 RepID=UPI002ADDA25D|nr:uncharacterized protein LOC133525652 isoform X1 [Cydia pomonella]